MRSRITALLTLGLVLTAAAAYGQGSIFGQVQNSDFSVPANKDIVFFGYIGDTDNELRTNTLDGAGFDNGNWFDDFQNYQSESPGQPYDYYFFNLSNLESAHLAKTIPANSFQQEDIFLNGTSFPAQADNLSAEPIFGVGIRLSWVSQSLHSYHIYRRIVPSNGSFFRIDNPGGDLNDAGIAGNEFIDTDIDSVSTYEYVLVSETTPGNYSPPSIIVSANSACVANNCSSCCAGIRGNTNGDVDDKITILDVTYLISYLFGIPTGPAPTCTEEGNANGDMDEKVTILDVTYLVAYLFGIPTGPAPPACP